MKTSGQLREEIMAKALLEPDFRKRLLEDPKAALREDCGVNLPDGFTLHVHENNGVDVAHILLPPAAELSDEEMTQVAGGCDGKSDYIWDC